MIEDLIKIATTAIKIATVSILLIRLRLLDEPDEPAKIQDCANWQNNYLCPLWFYPTTSNVSPFFFMIKLRK